jgi:hypothetical protein
MIETIALALRNLANPRRATAVVMRVLPSPYALQTILSIPKVKVKDR